MPEAILYEVSENIATVTMNRPEVKNAHNLTMLKELREAVEKVEHDEEVHVAVLQGTGGTFSSGADLASVLQEAKDINIYTIPSFIHRYYNSLILSIFNSSKLWIAKVEGYAAGAACNLALACDFVYAAENAVFYEAFSRRGLSVDAGGSFLLVHLVGLRKAKELLLFADKLPAPRAAELGLINEAVPEGELEAKVREVAQRIKKGPRKTFWQIKDLLHSALCVDFPTSLKLEEKAQGIAARSEDAQEGVAAFLQKREPNFKGK